MPNRLTRGRALVGRLSTPELQWLDKTVTSAQVLALFATPQTVVPAPGAGKCLIFVGARITLDYGGTAYVADAGDDIVFKYTNAAGVTVSVPTESTGFLTATSDQVRWAGAVTTADITPAVNAPLVIHILTSEVITGNSPLKVRTFFRIVPTDL